jgi:hypothetical protein
VTAEPTADSDPGGSELDAIVAFLGSLGFVVRFERQDGPEALPGITVEDGVVAVDPDRLVGAGDLLHECGHLAVMGPARRASARGRFDSGPAEEMAAIAWSYAALQHLHLDPAVVFHQHGYGGGGGWVVEAFARGGTMGVPALCWLGMTSHACAGQAIPGAVYPTMIAWLNDGARELR